MAAERQTMTSSPASKLQLPPILCLPDELLLNITRTLDRKTRQRSLYDLSLVNRRLSIIAHEELFHSPIVRTRQSARFVARILENPRLLRRVTSLEIALSYRGVLRADWTKCNCRDFDPFRWTECNHKLDLAYKCSNALKARGIEDESWRWFAGLQEGEAYAYFAFIIVITPNLRHLILPDTYMKALIVPSYGFRGRGTPLRPYLASSLKHVTKGLQEFTVLGLEFRSQFCTDWGAWNWSSLDMTSFKSVKVLTLPYFEMPTGFVRAKGATLRLPPSLNKFRITYCDFDIMSFLESFLEREGCVCPHLCEIEILWRKTDLAPQAKPDGCGKAPKLSAMERFMEQAGVKISWDYI